MRDDITWVTDVHGLDAVREPWEALTAERTHPFADHAWLRCWFQAFPPPGRVQIGLAWDGPPLGGVVPLQRRGTRLAALGNEPAS
jgi:hypothetical protein